MTISGDGFEHEFHPLDLEQAAAPFDALAELRSKCPVAHLGGENRDPITLVTSYEGVCEVYQARYAYSNQYSHSVVRDPLPSFDSSTLFTLDGDAHRRVRKAVLSALSPHVVDAAGDYIADLCRAVVAEIPDTGSSNLRLSWATRIPGQVVAHLLGVPEEDHERFLGWTVRKMEVLAQVTQGRATLADVRTADSEFHRYVDGLISKHRQDESTCEDILTRLLAVQDDNGEHLHDDEVRANAIFLLNAGNQTTQNLLMNLVHQLISNGLWGAVRMDRTLVPDAIEESLRLTPPIQYGVRRPLEEGSIGGRSIHLGEVIVLSHLAANRDPVVWGSDAETFKLGRANTGKHLGFGMGPHSCIGSAVARRVALLAMNALLDRFGDLRLAPDFEWIRQDYWTSLGVTSLDVEWDTPSL